MQQDEEEERTRDLHYIANFVVCELFHLVIRIKSQNRRHTTLSNTQSDQIKLCAKRGGEYSRPVHTRRTISTIPEHLLLLFLTGAEIMLACFSICNVEATVSLSETHNISG